MQAKYRMSLALTMLRNSLQCQSRWDIFFCEVHQVYLLQHFSLFTIRTILAAYDLVDLLTLFLHLMHLLESLL